MPFPRLGQAKKLVGAFAEGAAGLADFRQAEDTGIFQEQVLDQVGGLLGLVSEGFGAEANAVAAVASAVDTVISGLSGVPDLSGIETAIADGLTSMGSQHIGGNPSAMTLSDCWYKAGMFAERMHTLGLIREQNAIHFLASVTLPSIAGGEYGPDLYDVNPADQGVDESDLHFLERVKPGHSWDQYDDGTVGTTILQASGGYATFIYMPQDRSSSVKSSAFVYTPSSGPPSRNALVDALVMLQTALVSMGWSSEVP